MREALRTWVRLPSPPPNLKFSDTKDKNFKKIFFLSILLFFSLGTNQAYTNPVSGFLKKNLVDRPIEYFQNKFLEHLKSKRFHGALIGFTGAVVTDVAINSSIKFLIKKMKKVFLSFNIELLTNKI